jgi:hypothetical protein
MSSGQPHQFFDAPYVICDASFHRGRDPQRFVNPNKIVVHEVDCDRRSVIRGLLAERVCEPRKPPHPQDRHGRPSP